MEIRSLVFRSAAVLRSMNNCAISFYKIRYVMNSTGLYNSLGERACSRPFTVFVEGNIGSGKTTFLNTFNRSEALVLSEPVDLWRNVNGHNLLGTLYEDPKRWGFLFQSYVQLTMLDLHLKQTQHSLKLMERSVHSARHCFVENLYRSKTITEAELSVLDQWYKWIKTRTEVKGDLIVYLQTEPEVVYKRMKARNRQEEACVPLSYLKELHDLHEEWLIHKVHESKIKVIVVDANGDLDELKETYNNVKKLLINEVSQRVESVSV